MLNLRESLIMPKAKKKLSQTEQSKRFVETAKALGVDESGKSFEKAMRVVVKPKDVPARPSGKRS